MYKHLKIIKNAYFLMDVFWKMFNQIHFLEPIKNENFITNFTEKKTSFYVNKNVFLHPLNHMAQFISVKLHFIDPDFQDNKFDKNLIQHINISKPKNPHALMTRVDFGDEIYGLKVSTCRRINKNQFVFFKKWMEVDNMLRIPQIFWGIISWGRLQF